MNRIVYQAVDGAIYTVNPDGSERRRVSGVEGSQAGATNVWPVWSPDSGSIVFTALSPVGGRATEYSLRRGSALGTHEPVILHVDALSSNGINPGTPHYALWSPDGERIALITDAGQGIVTFNMDAERGLNLRGIYDGAPVYVSWATDSEHMLVHISEDLFLWTRDPETGLSMNAEIGSGSIAYRAPQWNPADNSYLYVDVIEGEPSLLLGDLDTPGPSLVRKLDDAIEFTWSPDGTKIALLTGRGEFFDRLEIIDSNGQAAGPTLDEPLRGAWWSPDGERLLLATADPDSEGVVVWSVLELDTGAIERTARVLPSNEAYLMLTFHSQYAASHQLWSPDSRHFVVVGALLGDDGESGRRFTESGAEVSRVWVVDSAGETAPVPIGEGLFAAWSPT